VDPAQAAAMIQSLIGLVMFIVAVLLVFAIFAIRRGVEKIARELEHHTKQRESVYTQLTTLNAQIEWLNNYFAKK
jgi:hypothetical protein